MSASGRQLDWLMLTGFSETQLKLLIVGIGLVAALFGWFGRGVSFLLGRWTTGAGKREEVTYLTSVADLAGKLRTSGMTLTEIADFEKLFRTPALRASPASTSLLIGTDQDEPDAFSNTVAMGARAAAASDVAEAQLQQALLDLTLLTHEAEREHLDAAYNTWVEYRGALKAAAGAEYAGGTFAPIAGTLAGMAETERKTAEVKLVVKERSARGF